MQFIWYASLAGAEFPAQEYEGLLQQVPESTAFNQLAWLKGAEQVLEKGQSLHVLTARVGGALVLCLPLMCCRERIVGLPVRTVRHLGYPLADRLALLVHPEHQQVLAKALQEMRRQLKYSQIQLHELCISEGQAGALDVWRKQCWYSEVRLSCRVPVHAITEADRQEPSGNVRYKLRKARKRCAGLPAEIRRITPTGQTVQQVVQAVTEVEQASWKGEQGVGIFSGALRQRWMQTAFQGMAERGSLKILSLEYEGRCISYRLGFLDKGRLYDYNLAFLPEFASLGSGRLLLDEWIRWGLDEGWQWVDASRVSLRDSSHQLHERCSFFISHYRWTLYSRRPAGLLLGAAYKLWQRIKRLKSWCGRQRAVNDKGET